MMINDIKRLRTRIELLREHHQVLVLFQNRNKEFLKYLFSTKPATYGNWDKFGEKVRSLLLNELMFFDLDKLPILNSLPSFKHEFLAIDREFLESLRRNLFEVKDVLKQYDENGEIETFFSSPEKYAGKSILLEEALEAALNDFAIDPIVDFQFNKFFDKYVDIYNVQGRINRSSLPSRNLFGRIKSIDDVFNSISQELQMRKGDALSNFFRFEPEELMDIIYDGNLLEDFETEMIMGMKSLIRHKKTNKVIGMVEFIDSFSLVADFDEDRYLRMVARNMNERQTDYYNTILSDVRSFREGILTEFRDQNPNETNFSWKEWYKSYEDFYWDNCLDMFGCGTQFIRIISPYLSHTDGYDFFDSYDYILGSSIAYCHNNHGYTGNAMERCDYVTDLVNVLKFANELERVHDLLEEGVDNV